MSTSADEVLLDGSDDDEYLNPAMFIKSSIISTENTDEDLEAVDYGDGSDEDPIAGQEENNDFLQSGKSGISTAGAGEIISPVDQSGQLEDGEIETDKHNIDVKATNILAMQLQNYPAQRRRHHASNSSKPLHPARGMSSYWKNTRTQFRPQLPYPSVGPMPLHSPYNYQPRHTFYHAVTPACGDSTWNARQYPAQSARTPVAHENRSLGQQNQEYRTSYESSLSPALSVAQQTRKRSHPLPHHPPPPYHQTSKSFTSETRTFSQMESSSPHALAPQSSPNLRSSNSTSNNAAAKLTPTTFYTAKSAAPPHAQRLGLLPSPPFVSENLQRIQPKLFVRRSTSILSGTADRLPDNAKELSKAGEKDNDKYQQQEVRRGSRESGQIFDSAPQRGHVVEKSTQENGPPSYRQNSRYRDLSYQESPAAVISMKGESGQDKRSPESAFVCDSDTLVAGNSENWNWQTSSHDAQLSQRKKARLPTAHAQISAKTKEEGTLAEGDSCRKHRKRAKDASLTADVEIRKLPRDATKTFTAADKDENRSVTKVLKLATEKSQAVLIESLAPTVSKLELQQMLSKSGTIEDLRLEWPHKGEAYVRFRSTDEANKARRQFHKSKIHGEVVKVTFMVKD